MRWSLFARLALSLLVFFTSSFGSISGLHIAVVCTFGTRSDVAPVLEGLKDFSATPGNTITYIAAPGISARHASQFPYISTRVVSQLVLPAYFNNSAIRDVMQTREHFDNTKVFLDGISMLADIYETNTAVFLDYFGRANYDLILCDAVEFACLDAARETGHKLALYGPLGQFGVGADWYVPDFLDPMPMESWIASPWKRAKGYFNLLPFAVAQIKANWKIQAAQARLGMRVPFMQPWDYPQRHLLLSHQVLGIEPARNIPTNIQVFGPVVNDDTIPPLEPEIQVALDRFHANGTRVVFIAFGSVLTLKDSPELYDVMLRSIKDLLADTTRNLAVIWASAYHDPARVRAVTTLYPGRFLTPRWANQRRCLMHNAVKLLINHGGYGSIVETLYNGKGQIMVPFVFDEFVNAANGDEAGISLSMDKYTMTSGEMTTKVRTLLDAMADDTSSYSGTLRKWKQICRLNSERGRMIVSNSVTMAATVGFDHLVPRDVDLSIFDRFDVATTLAVVLAIIWARKQMQTRVIHSRGAKVEVS